MLEDPAYPTPSGVIPGMTLRDYFAGLAMQAYAGDIKEDSHDAQVIAVAAYIIADAMLAERAT